MANLLEWKNKLEGGLQKLQQDLEKLQVTIQRQEGALMMVQELLREQEKADAGQPAPITTDDVEPI